MRQYFCNLLFKNLNVAVDIDIDFVIAIEIQKPTYIPF